MKNLLFIFFAILTFLTLEHFTVHDDGDDAARTKSFIVKKGGLLEVSVNGGDIRVVPWDKSEVLVKAHGTDEEGFGALEMTSNENTVHITNTSSKGWSGDARLDINVPASFRLDLKTVTGDIVIEGPLSGTFKASTSAGDIRLGDLSGSVRVNTSAGSITVDKIQGDLHLETSGGDIVVGSVDGSADVSTSGGNIKLANVKRTLHAKTQGGDVKVGDVGVSAEVVTLGGNVVVGKVSGGVALVTAGGDIDLAGARGVISASTGGGNIRLSEITGSVMASTGGGDVDAELVPTGHGNSMIVSGGGIIRLYVPDSARATIDAKIHVKSQWEYDRENYHIRSSFRSDDYQKYHEKKEIQARYILNGGGQTIKLETDDADIEISKLASHPR